VHQEDNKIVLHACCAICSGYPISLLKDMGYSVVVYFYNPNIYPDTEYSRRLDAEYTLCRHLGAELIEGNYEPEIYEKYIKGLETEPEKGLRCNKCFELRLKKTAQFCKAHNINTFTTSIVISPHKNIQKLAAIGNRIAGEYGLNYLNIDFKKKDGFLKTNKISKQLNLYRQNYCGCKFAMR